MTEVEISAPMRRAPALFDFFHNGVCGNVARRGVTAEIAATVAIDELCKIAIEQFSAQFVAKRIPHDRIHADQARGEVSYGKELHELHVDKFGARPQSQSVGFTSHVGRSAVARVKLREPTGRKNNRLGLEAEKRAARQVKSNRTVDAALSN